MDTVLDVVLVARIEGEAEPQEWAAETNARDGPAWRRKARSPVRIRRSRLGKALRIRENLRPEQHDSAEHLSTRGLRGGAVSNRTTRLRGRFPDLQGKFKELFPNQAWRGRRVEDAISAKLDVDEEKGQIGPHGVPIDDG